VFQELSLTHTHTNPLSLSHTHTLSLSAGVHNGPRDNVDLALRPAPPAHRRPARPLQPGYESYVRDRAVQPEQCLQRHPEVGSSWPSWRRCGAHRRPARPNQPGPASKQREKSSKYFEPLVLTMPRAKARIWPWLAYLFRVRSRVARACFLTTMSAVERTWLM